MIDGSVEAFFIPDPNFPNLGEKFWASVGGSGPPLERSPVLSYLPHHLYFSPLLYFSLLYFLLSLFAFACKGRWLEPLIILTSEQTLFPAHLHYSCLYFSTFLLYSFLAQLPLPTSSDCGNPATPFYPKTNTKLLSANILQHSDFLPIDSIIGRPPSLNVNYFIAKSATYFGLVLFKLFLLNFVVLILFLSIHAWSILHLVFLFISDNHQHPMLIISSNVWFRSSLTLMKSIDME